MKGDVEIRLLETQDEFRACHAVQRAAWSFPDLLIIPYTQLITIQHHGGVVLGAFDAGRLVGFVYGFLARHGTRPPYLFSQRMGVLPEYQGQGIGERLKWAQRAWAIEHGLDCIVWTYDPLEAPNARLNICKLGGVARRYERDIYGQHDSPLHIDLPTDRFLVDWELLSGRVMARAAGAGAVPDVAALLGGAALPLAPVAWDDRGMPHIGSPDLARTDPEILVEVPAEWQRLKHLDLELAMAWRLHVRTIFEHLFAAGYTVTDYASGMVAERRRNFYHLERDR